ncbi:MAG: class I SAM-dependent methyltransferase [Thermoplasmatales archaeon]|nr:class I SAM-dependent methyltransferase [Thermoplasmatales archaeon]MCW6169596.1 class I SAM-dependent methyltransferase [Thermoplasmatales archaeon]
MVNLIYKIAFSIILSEQENLYLEGEEKFGFFSSLFYPIVNIIPTTRNFYKFVLSEIEKKDFDTLLDIGSGRGTVLIRIGKIKKNSRLVGFDPSPSMVKRANHSAAKSGFSDRIKFLLGSSRSLDPKEKYDIIITTLSFHHWKNREQSIENIMNALRPTGEFIIFEITNNGAFNRRFVRSHLMSRAEFNSIGSKIGYIPAINEQCGFISASFKKND